MQSPGGTRYSRSRFASLGASADGPLSDLLTPQQQQMLALSSQGSGPAGGRPPQPQPQRASLSAVLPNGTPAGNGMLHQQQQQHKSLSASQSARAAPPGAALPPLPPGLSLSQMAEHMNARALQQQQQQQGASESPSGASPSSRDASMDLMASTGLVGMRGSHSLDAASGSGAMVMMMQLGGGGSPDPKSSGGDSAKKGRDSKGKKATGSLSGKFKSFMDKF
jgi:hypothetical protein